ncbi:hypothetical protein [Nostoc sp.]
MVSSTLGYNTLKSFDYLKAECFADAVGVRQHCFAHLMAIALHV